MSSRDKVATVAAARWLGRWWSKPDLYDQMSSRLHARGMAGFTRAVIAVISGGLGVVGLASIWTPAAPRTAAQLVCTVCACAGAVVGGLVWALRWPTRATAIRLTLLSVTCISLVTMGLSDPTVAVLSCTVFAATASYIALFHSTPLMAANFSAAAVIGGFESVQIAQSRTVVGALCGYSVVLLLNLAVPFGVQIVVNVLGNDAKRAEHDQLTGLLNRYAFYRYAKLRLAQGRDHTDHFVAVVIDLDNFKQLNDNHGHQTGDDALASVAHALQTASNDTAVICRCGGEEFVIADMWAPNDIAAKAQRLCDAIAALPFDITASIGTAGIGPASDRSNRDELLTDLICAADAAMYVAKRRGGNQIAQH